MLPPGPANLPYILASRPEKIAPTSGTRPLRRPHHFLPIPSPPLSAFSSRTMAQTRAPTCSFFHPRTKEMRKKKPAPSATVLLRYTFLLLQGHLPFSHKNHSFPLNHFEFALHHLLLLHSPPPILFSRLLLTPPLATNHHPQTHLT